MKGWAKYFTLFLLLNCQPILADGPKVGIFNIKSSSLTLITNENNWKLGQSLMAELEPVYSLFEGPFGSIPENAAIVKLLEEEDFFQQTGAPAWTNALYYRGQIYLPINAQKDGKENLVRSIKHEYTHALLAAISSNKIPGWLDEGMAQWIEGNENPLLRPALLKYLKRNQPIPFSMLQGGFTQLSNNMVAASYGQSLIASQVLIDTFGLAKIGKFLKRLTYQEQEEAFRDIFGISVQRFEMRLGTRLKDWAHNFDSEGENNPSHKGVHASLQVKARADVKGQPNNQVK